MDTNFIGRKDDLKRLNLLLTKKSASLVIIRGRRRIGKSRLVEEFAKRKRFIHFVGLPPTEGTTAQDQRDVFSKQLGEQFNLPGLMATDWTDLFNLLYRQVETGQIIILFDEISWMGSKDPTFLGKLKTAWDLHFKKNRELILILCGSVSTWIEENIVRNTGFFGRISAYLTVEELPLNDCNKLLESQGFRGPPREKLKILSLTGGIPWYIEQILPNMSADDNIRNLCFNSDGILVQEFDLIFHDLFITRNEIYKRIIEILSVGTLEFNDIVEKLKYHKSGALSDYLNDLRLAGFISRDFTWSLKTGKESRLSHFRLSDNYLRFYLKYIAGNSEKIRGNGFADISLSTLPGWESIMGLQFENLVLKNRKKIKNLLGIKSSDVIIDNPHFQRKTTLQEGCQIDYLIQTRFQLLFPCEIKFSKNEIKSDIINEMRKKLDKFSLPKGFALSPVLIHVNGVDESIIESGYFSHIIDFSSLLEEE